MTNIDLKNLLKLHTRLTRSSTELVNLLIELEEITRDLRTQGYDITKANHLLRDLENFYHYPQIRRIIVQIDQMHEWVEGELEHPHC